MDLNGWRTCFTKLSTRSPRFHKNICAYNTVTHNCRQVKP